MCNGSRNESSHELKTEDAKLNSTEKRRDVAFNRADGIIFYTKMLSVKSCRPSWQECFIARKTGKQLDERKSRTCIEALNVI
jgi:hypothetical protein